MKNNKTTIKQALDLFGISRTTLYSYLKKLNTKPKKDGKNAYLTDKQITDIKGYISSICSPEQMADEQTEQTEQINNNEKISQKQIKELKKELKKEREENKNLVREVGRWEGVARTLQDQNQKLLELKTEDEEADTVEAEIVEPEPAPEKKAEKSKKQGFFQKLFKIKS